MEYEITSPSPNLVIAPMGENKRFYNEENQSPLSVGKESKRGLDLKNHETQGSMDESVQFNTYKNVLDNMTFQPANDTL